MWSLNSVKKALLSAASFVDEKYSSHRQKLDFDEYVDYNEFGLALDSLLELVDETGDRFRIEFWISLKEAAKLMKLTEEMERINCQLNELRG